MLNRSLIVTKPQELSKFEPLLKESGESLATLFVQVHSLGKVDFDHMIVRFRRAVTSFKSQNEVAGLLVEYYKNKTNENLVDVIERVLAPLYEVLRSYPYHNRVFDRMIEFFRYERSARKMESNAGSTLDDE